MSFQNATLSRVLAAFDDPDAGVELLQAYAEQAPLYVEHDVVAAGSLDPAAFARTHAGAVAAAGPTAPRPRQLKLLRVDGDVSWHEATDLHDGRTLWIAAGWAGERLAWLTLAAEPAAWDFARGRLETLGNFIYGEPAGQATPRSWLDLAHHGLYAYEDVRFETMPGARFGCHMSGQCCSKPYAVRLPRSARALIDALGLDAPPLELTERGELVLKRPGDDACVFLGPGNLCRVHAAAGKQPFPPCLRYPLQFAETPDAVHVTAQWSCGSVRANLGPKLADQRPLLRTLLATGRGRLPEAVHLAPGRPMAWDAYLALEARLIEALQPSERSLWQRLLDAEQILADATGVQPPEEAPVLAFERVKLEAMALAFMAPLGVEGPSTHEPTWEPHPQDEVLAGMARGVLYAKTFAYAYDLVFAFHVAVWLVVLAAHVRTRVPGGQVPEPTLRLLATMFMHDSFLRQLAEDDRLSRYIGERLAAPGFGKVALLALGDAPL